MAARAVSVVGMAFGDEGKGSIVDSICRRHNAKLVCRFNGGAQAGHMVVDGNRSHIFAQWGAGTFAGARTHLSRFMLFNPIFAIAEAKRLVYSGISDPFSLMTIERGALVTTPFHVAANRIRETARGQGRHGSCGMGIGETVGDAFGHYSDVVRVGDRGSALIANLRSIQWRKRRELEELAWSTRAMEVDWEILNDHSEPARVALQFETVFSRVMIVDRDWLQRELRSDGVVVFEGAQGVLLDETHGTAPYNTWSNCTFGNADELLAGSGAEVERIGVLRAYHTRHGPGPFPSEHPDFDALSADDHNTTGPWQGRFRSGMLDTDLVTNAAKILRLTSTLDGVAVTRLDRLPMLVRVRIGARRRSAGGHGDFQYTDRTSIPGIISEFASAPIVCESFGPEAKDKLAKERSGGGIA